MKYLIIDLFAFSKETFVLEHAVFNLINKIIRSEFCLKLHGKSQIG